jgi:perosamine synthetase
MTDNIRIPLDAPNIGELEKEYVTRAIESGYVSTAGPLIGEFEERFAACVGARYAVATVNGTSAIHLALRLLGIGPGDEVIVPALTFVGTVNPVVYVGATPVAVDVDPLTWNIGVEALEQAITERTRAVIPVHLYGNPADMTAVGETARRYGLYIIEDAAEALGAAYQNRHVGTFGDVGVFSFNGNKVITAGGGGMLVTKDPALAERARLLVNQGRAPGITEFEHQEIGYNYRLTNLQAALGLAQMERLPEFLAVKGRNAALYRELLAGEAGLVWQRELGDARSSWWLFSVLVDAEQHGGDRVTVADKLRAAGVQARPLFKPLTQQSPYRKLGWRACPVAESLHARGISLPSASFLREDDIRETCRLLKTVGEGR